MKIKISRAAAVAALLPMGTLLVKFLLFDVIWCMATTFKAFSTWQLWLTAIFGAVLLSAPSVLCRRRWPQIVVMLLTDMWLVANLMYSRTYFTAIPPSSYLLAGNLADFMPSVVDSLRWADILFPLTTAAYAWIAWRRRVSRMQWKPYLPILGASAIALGIGLWAGGGLRRMYGSLQLSAHLYASGPAMYTPAGHVVYGLLSAAPEISPEQRVMVANWLASYPPLSNRCDSVYYKRENLILVLAESLESWVIGATVEGHEITPCLNALVADSTTLYAPHILTQVKGGRSIDAQLLALAGLIPLETGTYSVQYPSNTYYTLPKALRKKYGARSYLLTVDKAKTWNQGAIARSFGIDTILSYPDFELTVTAGSRKRLADMAFVEQIIGKLDRREIWPEGEPAYVQIVTYSGHAPFRLPENLRKISFSADVPELLANYMITANYTDAALGRLIDYLRSRSDYERTVIVITGDHEGLAQNRAGLVADARRLGLDIAGQYTPFIVVNSPRGGRVDVVAGQVDMYPTLIELLGLNDYRWHGLGRSLLDAGRPSLAVGSAYNVDGDTVGMGAEISRLRDAHRVSDLILRYDLLAE